MPPFPPIIVPAPIVNYTPPSDPGLPPWLAALLAAIVGVLGTNIATRGREHRRILWEKRFEIFTDLLVTLRRVESVGAAFNAAGNFTAFKEAIFKPILEGLDDPRLDVESLIAPDLSDRIETLRIDFMKIVEINQDNQYQKRSRLAPHFDRVEKVTLDLRDRINDEIKRPPPLIFLPPKKETEAP